MSKKTIIIVLSIVGSLLLLGLLGTHFVNSLKKDREAMRKRIVEVKEVYSVYSGHVDAFNEIRNNLYSTVLDNVYYDTLASTDKSLKEVFANYEKEVDGVASVVSKLANYCEGVYYTDKSITTKCESYASVYEQIVNAFISDVDLYNSIIDTYNEGIEEGNTEGKLEHYKTSKKYIDYNGDKKYEGKEE